MEFRTVERSIWRHRVMRAGTEHARQLFLYLVTGAADCEGRFDADPFALLDGCWSAVHQISVEDVRQALDELVTMGTVLLYAVNDKPLGFLLGWYEHQRVDQKHRDGSSLPSPPILLCSWAAIDRVRTFYADYADLRGTNISRKAAISWFQGLPEDEQTRLLPPNGALRGNLPECAESAQKVEQEGKGREGIGEEGTGKVRTSTTSMVDYGSANGSRADLGAMKQNYPALQAATWTLPWPPRIRDLWFEELVTAIEHPGHWLEDERRAAELLAEFPPLPEEKHLPAKWLERLEKGRRQAVAAAVEEERAGEEQEAVRRAAVGLVRSLVGDWPPEQIRSIMREQYSAEVIQAALEEVSP